MRKILGPVLVGLGGFLIVIGVLCVVWAPGVVKKTPIDVETTTNLSGTVSKLGDPEQPVKVQSITRTDTDASTDDVALWFSTSCVVIDVDDAPPCVDGDDDRLVSADNDVFATDRVTAEAVDFEGLPAEAVPHEGLVNKWPFDAEKKDYVYWDGTVGRGVPAVYDREDSLLGVDVYVYKITLVDEAIEVAEGVDGTYDNVIEIWVEPKTGSIQQQTQDQQRYLDDGTQVLDLSVGFTEEQQQTFADEAKDNMGMLKLILFWLPLIGFVVGGVAVLVGVLLILGSRRTARTAGHDARTPEHSAA